TGDRGRREDETAAGAVRAVVLRHLRQQLQRRAGESRRSRQAPFLTPARFRVVIVPRTPAHYQAVHYVNTITGSTRVARRAGHAQARIATTTSSVTTDSRTHGFIA